MTWTVFGSRKARWSREEGSRKEEEWRKKEMEGGSFKVTCGPTIYFGYLLIGSYVIENHLHVKTPEQTSL
jgi:hypothetical protein